MLSKARTTAKKRLPLGVVSAIDKSKILGIRAGTDHRIIGIWAVVVDGRVFVRSWGVKADGWYRAFLEDPHGVITVEGRKRPIRIRARPARGARLLQAVSRAYAAKFDTPGSVKYVRDLSRRKSSDTTTELLPL